MLFADRCEDSITLFPEALNLGKLRAESSYNSRGNLSPTLRPLLKTLPFIPINVMTSNHSQDEDRHRREQELKDREVSVRFRELDAKDDRSHQ